MNNPTSAPTSKRWRALVRLDRWLEPLMVLLGLAWLALLIAEFVWGTAPPMQLLSNVIWILFVCEFGLRFSLAPQKGTFLARNWITLVALAIPAVRILRFARALRLMRATRGLRFVRLLTSTNRALRSLGTAMRRRGAGYVGALTLAVTLAGAAGMLLFEGRGDAAFDGFGEALWWTAMLITTLGSDYWPLSTEGRLLALLLSIYAMGVFGYLAATLTSYLIGRDASQPIRSKEAEAISALRQEIRDLKDFIANSRPVS